MIETRGREVRQPGGRRAGSGTVWRGEQKGFRKARTRKGLLRGASRRGRHLEEKAMPPIVKIQRDYGPAHWGISSAG